MILVPVPSTWRTGEHKVYVLSKTVLKEWQELAQRRPDDARRCYERLASLPLQPFGGRQVPLKGKNNRGFWQYEVSSGDRVHYCVLPDATDVMIVSAGKHPRSGVSLGITLKKRSR